LRSATKIRIGFTESENAAEYDEVMAILGVELELLQGPGKPKKKRTVQATIVAYGTGLEQVQTENPFRD